MYKLQPFREAVKKYTLTYLSFKDNMVWSIILGTQYSAFLDEIN